MHKILFSTKWNISSYVAVNFSSILIWLKKLINFSKPLNRKRENWISLQISKSRFFDSSTFFQIRKFFITGTSSLLLEWIFVSHNQIDIIETGYVQVSRLVGRLTDNYVYKLRRSVDNYCFKENWAKHWGGEIWHWFFYFFDKVFLIKMPFRLPGLKKRRA